MLEKSCVYRESGGWWRHIQNLPGQWCKKEVYLDSDKEKPSLHYTYHIMRGHTYKRRNRNIYLKLQDGASTFTAYGSELTCSGLAPQFIIESSMVKILFLVLPPVQLLDQLLQRLKELILVKLRRLVQLVQRSQIMISILKLEKHLSMGLGTLTLKDQQLAMMLLGIDMVLFLCPNS